MDQESKLEAFCRQRRLLLGQQMTEVARELDGYPIRTPENRARVTALIAQFENLATMQSRARMYYARLGCPACYIEDGATRPLDQEQTYCTHCGASFL